MPKKKTGQRKKAEKQKARQKEIGDKSKYPKYITSYNIRHQDFNNQGSRNSFHKCFFLQEIQEQLLNYHVTP